MINKNYLIDIKIKYYFKNFIFVMKVYINDNVMYISLSSWRFVWLCVSIRGDIFVYFL